MIPKTLFTIVNLLCIVAAAYLLVDGVYGSLADRLTAEPLSAQQPVYSVSESYSSPQPLATYNPVLERNLFNTRTASSTPQNQKVDVESLEETKLNLKLWGTVSGTQSGDYAVIEDVKTRE